MLGDGPGQGWGLCFPLSLHASWLGFGIGGSTNLDAYLFIGWSGPDAFDVVGAPPGFA